RRDSPERLKKSLWWLGAREHDLSVDDKERHAIHAESPGRFARLLDRIHPVFAIQGSLSLALVQTRLGNHSEEHLRVADISPLGEIRTEKRLHDGILNAFLIGPSDEPMGVECVRRALDSIKSEKNPFRSAHDNDFGVKFLRA